MKNKIFFMLLLIFIAIHLGDRLYCQELAHDYLT